MMQPSKTRWIAEEVGIRRGRAEVCVVDAGVDVVVGVKCVRVRERESVQRDVDKKYAAARGKAVVCKDTLE